MASEAVKLKLILKKKRQQDVNSIWGILPDEIKIYVFEEIRAKNYTDLGEFEKQSLVKIMQTYTANVSVLCVHRCKFA